MKASVEMEISWNCITTLNLCCQEIVPIVGAIFCNALAFFTYHNIQKCDAHLLKKERSWLKPHRYLCYDQ